jgi:hypothetical protein
VTTNYYYRYTRPLDFAFYKQLRKPIAKSLYTLLENGWYAAEGKPFAKSYSAICNEFLLQEFTHISRIRQQLDPSHKELQRLELIENWEYRKAARGNDYIIIYYPGRKFFRDVQEKDKRRDGYALKAGQLTYDCRYSTMHGMPITGGRGFRGLKPLWYNGVPP